LRRGIVAQLTVGAEEARGLADERDERGKILAARCEKRRLGSGQSFAHGLGRARGANDRPEQLGIAAPARRREGIEEWSDFFETSEWQAAMADPKRRGFAGLGQEPAHDGLVRREA
jgi:hypothetical protein